MIGCRTMSGHARGSNDRPDRNFDGYFDAPTPARLRPRPPCTELREHGGDLRRGRAGGVRVGIVAPRHDAGGVRVAASLDRIGGADEGVALGQDVRVGADAVAVVVGARRAPAIAPPPVPLRPAMPLPAPSRPATPPRPPPPAPRDPAMPAAPDPPDRCAGKSTLRASAWLRWWWPSLLASAVELCCR
jgi:hypothetical protein